MAQFNIGDKVIGKEGNGYSITGWGYVGTVLGFSNDGDHFYLSTSSDNPISGDTNIEIDGKNIPAWFVRKTGFELYTEEARLAFENRKNCPFSVGDYVTLKPINDYNNCKFSGIVRQIDKTDFTVKVYEIGRHYGHWLKWRELDFICHENEWTDALENHEIVCACCGQVVSGKFMLVDGHFVCEDCKDEITTCDHCGKKTLSTPDNEFDGEIWCATCLNNNTEICACCGERFYQYDMTRTGDGDMVCESCLEDKYFYCEHCGEYHNTDNAYYDRWDNIYCESCYNSRNDGVIESYYYKPIPIFYGNAPDDMYMGVELEIDGAGEDGDNAEYLMDIANDTAEHIYCKHDGSLEDGFEIVSHPATLEYHTHNIQWQRVMEKALSMEYRSHYAGTCGLHCHISRKALGKDYDEQEETISKIIYFVELHWEEILKFSRRTRSDMDHWAAQYGIECDCKKTYEKAKGDCNRYHCINLENEHTVEFRMFRGTLKYNTFLATLQLVDEVCRTCLALRDTEVEAQSWSEFVSAIDSEKKPELITYLKERNLYICDNCEIDENEEEQ